MTEACSHLGGDELVPPQSLHQWLRLRYTGAHLPARRIYQTRGVGQPITVACSIVAGMDVTVFLRQQSQ